MNSETYIKQKSFLLGISNGTPYGFSMIFSSRNRDRQAAPGPAAGASLHLRSGLVLLARERGIWWLGRHLGQRRSGTWEMESWVNHGLYAWVKLHEHRPFFFSLTLFFLTVFVNQENGFRQVLPFAIKMKVEYGLNIALTSWTIEHGVWTPNVSQTFDP